MTLRGTHQEDCMPGIPGSGQAAVEQIADAFQAKLMQVVCMFPSCQSAAQGLLNGMPHSLKNNQGLR